MDTSLIVRVAQPSDEEALAELIPRSARALSAGFYSPAQIDGAVKYVFGVDSTLIRDGTYFVAEAGPVIKGCGGWSRRRTLYGGNQHKAVDDPLLDPAVDAARIRAFFVAPEFARQGVGRQLMRACANAAYDAGFRQLELVATLPGVPLYEAFGFHGLEEVIEHTPEGVSIPFLRMVRALDSPMH
ncbi:MAG: GNAT family N-acetyltransferase [Gemmatimonadaceae bacterium]